MHQNFFLNTQRKHSMFSFIEKWFVLLKDDPTAREIDIHVLSNPSL